MLHKRHKQKEGLETVIYFNGYKNIVTDVRIYIKIWHRFLMSKPEIAWRINLEREAPAYVCVLCAYYSLFSSKSISRSIVPFFVQGCRSRSMNLFVKTLAHLVHSYFLGGYITIPCCQFFFIQFSWHLKIYNTLGTALWIDDSWCHR